MIRKTLLAATLLVVGSAANAGVILTENFDAAPAGWTTVNNSTAGGTTGWFQGNPGVFGSQGGAADSYIAANFNNAGAGGDISNWLITPTLNLGGGGPAFLSFWTRQEAVGFADRLEVRLSTSGSGVGGTTGSVGDFTTLLLTLNPALAADGYPADWTQFTVNLGTFADGTIGQLAFRYFVTDTSVNGNYIGIDSLGISVPEPSFLALLIAALAPLGFAARRRFDR